MRIIYLAILALCFSQIAFAAYANVFECIANTTACQKVDGKGEIITFCSQNDETITFSQLGLHPPGKINLSCMNLCGVNVKHVGECGCPSGCYSDLGRGTCDSSSSTKKCTCNAGWAGKDCSAISCPNTCSGHGTCSIQTSKGNVHTCTCEEGWTSADCSVQVPSAFRSAPYGTLPYGEVADGVDYYANDAYKDLHPFFNTSRVATVKIWVTDAFEKYLLDPNVTYTQEYVNAKLFFDNGVITTYSDCTFRIKGSSTRINPKKSWNVKLKTKDAIKGLRGFSIKSNIADRVVTSQLAVEFYRAMKVETYRSSIAEFYLNDRFYGLERLEERINDDYELSRWNVKGNMYKLGPYSMAYLGEDPNSYMNFNTTLYGTTVFGIEQEEGDGNFSDITQFVSSINAPYAASTAYLQNNVDVTSVIKGLAMEAIIKNADAYMSTGNNYLFVDAGNSSVRPYWKYGAFDFDVAMLPLEDSFAPVLGMTGAQLKAYMAMGITQLGPVNLTNSILSDNPYDLIARTGKPLSTALFRVPGNTDIYTATIKEFIKRIIIDRPNLVQTRRDAYVQLTRSLVARDRLFAVMPTTTSYPGKGLETFDIMTNTTIDWINQRWSYLVSFFFANNQGTCNSVGVCVCKDNYYGQYCDQFCGVTFSQTKTNSWTSGSDQWSQYSVTINVGSQPLYGAVIKAITSATTFNPWNIDKVPSSTDLYTIPNWQYSNGQLNAYSNNVQFGYTISSASPAVFKLDQNACLPKSCPVSLVATKTSSWDSGNTHYEQLKYTVTNQGTTQMANAKVQLNFYGNSYVSSSWNIAPSTSNAGTASQNFTLSLYNLNPGQSYDGCGLTLSVPSSYAATNTIFSDAHIISAVCV